MKLVDILKAQGLTDDQISKIQASMQENKVYETSLENADKFKDGLTKKEVETLKEEHSKALEQQSLNFKKDILIKDKFSHIQESDIREYLISKIDKENMNIKEDGTSDELDNQYETIKQSNPNFFNDDIPNNTGGLGNFDRNPGGGGATESLGERLAKQTTEINTNNHNYFGGAN